MNTKQKIIKEALALFAKKGYSDVYVSDIAQAVGIKAPSLYKHFKNKQEIFNAILEELKKSYTRQAEMLHINGNNTQIDADIYAEAGEDVFVEMGKGLFLYFLHDEYVKLFRKMLTIEQFHNAELSGLYSRQYFDDPLAYQSSLFSFMIGRGIFKEENADIMALHFYSPIYTLLTLCDRHPDREKEALEILEEHIKQFNRIYIRGIKDEDSIDKRAEP